MAGNGALCTGIGLNVDPDSEQSTIPLSRLPSDSPQEPDLSLCDACFGLIMKFLHSGKG